MKSKHNILALVRQATKPPLPYAIGYNGLEHGLSNYSRNLFWRSLHVV